MEDTLRGENEKACLKAAKVLILVLMEDTLREQLHCCQLVIHLRVLILVLMEDTLRAMVNLSSFAHSLS